MAWSPLRRSNAGISRVANPETTPPQIPTNSATAPALGLFKEAYSALPKGEKRDEIEQKIKAAEASLARSDAALAKQLWYQLCDCTWPPQIMLWRQAEG